MQLVRQAAAAVTTFLLSASAWAQPSDAGSSIINRVPEPETLPLIALGVAGAVVVVRYFKNKK